MRHRLIQISCLMLQLLYMKWHLPPVFPNISIILLLSVLCRWSSLSMGPWVSIQCFPDSGILKNNWMKQNSFDKTSVSNSAKRSFNIKKITIFLPNVICIDIICSNPRIVTFREYNIICFIVGSVWWVYHNAGWIVWKNVMPSIKYIEYSLFLLSYEICVKFWGK